MPERTGDPNGVWRFETGYPGADLQVNPIAVQAPKLVEATGLDGRFIGALRPFPGMADTTVHGVPKPETGVTEVESISNVEFARYVSIQKGTSRDTLKGIVYVADNTGPAGVGKSVYFAYRDSSDNSTDVIELEDLDTWDDFKLTSLSSGNYDVTSMGRYIYFVASGDTTSTVGQWQDKEPAYSKAYWWDYKINDWDKFVTGMDGRFMGLMARRLIESGINEAYVDTLLSGDGGATTASNATIDLSADTPDLSGVSDGDSIYLSGTTAGGLTWSSSHVIDTDGVDDVADTVTVTVAPAVTDTDVMWRIETVDSAMGSYYCMGTQVGGVTTAGIENGYYTLAGELVSRKHNLRSYFRWHTLNRTTGGLRFYFNRLNLPVDQPGATHQIKANTHNSSCLIQWGIPHMDGFRLYRTVGVSNDVPKADYEPVSLFHLVDEYVEHNTYSTGSGIISRQIDHSQSGDVPSQLSSTFYSDDGGLQSQTMRDTYLDDWGPAPRFKRLQAYDGLLVGVTDVEEPADPDEEWDTTEQVPEAIAWSTLVAREPENFPAENQYRPDDAGEKFYVLTNCGDHLFAITNAGIYRISRSGSQIGVNRLQYRLGGVSRHGACGVGSLLFVVTPAGIRKVDANTGAISNLSAMDRIILDDSEWAGSLASVHMEYDAQIGALVMLNTSTKECYIMWESSGAVTKLEDCPWTFLTAGPDVMSDGPQRVYFIMSDATVHVIDGAREMGKRTMCGTGATETVNGTLTSAPDATSIIDSGATFPVGCEGFKVHMLSGDCEGESVTISTRTANDLTVAALSTTPAIGDRYSIAPVVTKVTLPQIVAQGGQLDPFVRKVSTSMSVAFSDLGGETTSGDNPYFRMGMKKGTTVLGTSEVGFDAIPDQVVGRTNFGDTRLHPYLVFKGSNQDYEIQAVMVKGILGVSEAQSRQTS